ncbi:hypothetical protein [uncultured Campylobacter sp.]|uniref:hypothetical protein n=1 Tax=uncultured Campylobacter sp. TaxID=218934 RepID=UPI00262AFB31|nr:hypothetical protein [uncultured Campylobacter sp.]
MKEAKFTRQLSCFTFTLLSAAALLPDTPPLCKISDIGANLCAHINTAWNSKTPREILKFQILCVLLNF